MRKKSNNPTPPARQRLLEAAMDVFGRHGYEGATTRMIAKEAQVNIASIPYYFKGKEGLYKALIQEIVSLIQSQVKEVQDEIAVTDFSDDGGQDKARYLLERLLDKLLTFMIGFEQAPRVARIIIREQLFPSAAYDIIYNGFMGTIMESTAGLLKIIAPRLSIEEAKLRAVSLTGQIVIFRIARETVVRALSYEGYTKDEMQKIRTVILSHTKTVLDDLQAEKG